MVGVLADQPFGGPERAEVPGIVGLQLVDDQVAHADGPAAEAHQENGQERQEPVLDGAPHEGPVGSRDQALLVPALRRGTIGRRRPGRKPSPAPTRGKARPGRDSPIGRTVLSSDLRRAAIAPTRLPRM